MRDDTHNIPGIMSGRWSLGHCLHHSTSNPLHSASTWCMYYKYWLSRLGNTYASYPKVVFIEKAELSLTQRKSPDSGIQGPEQDGSAVGQVYCISAVSSQGLLREPVPCPLCRMKVNHSRLTSEAPLWTPRGRVEGRQG